MKKNMILSDFYCTQCGLQTIPVFRNKGKQREAGHLKKLFCLKCNKEQNCVECRPPYTKEDFEIEFKYHNFTPKGQRIYTYKQLKGLIADGKISEETLYTCGGAGIG